MNINEGVAKAIEEETNEVVAQTQTTDEGVAKAIEETNEVVAQMRSTNEGVAKKTNEEATKAVEETNEVVAQTQKRNEGVAKANEKTNDVVAVKAQADERKHLIDRLGLVWPNVVGLFDVFVRFMSVLLLWSNVLRGDEGKHLIDRFTMFCEKVCVWAVRSVIIIGFVAIFLRVDGFGFVWRNLGSFVVGIIAFSISGAWVDPKPIWASR